MVRGCPHIRTTNPCERCTRLPDCEEFIRRLEEVVDWEAIYHLGYEPPTVIVDCEGRYSPESRTRKLRVR